MVDPIEEGLKIIPELTAEALQCLGESATFYQPRYTWQYHIGNLTVPSATAPSRFHRFVQRVLLGIVWEKLSD